MCERIWFVRGVGFASIILSVMIGAIMLAVGTSSVGVCSFAFGFPYTSAVAVNSCNDTLPLPMRWLSMTTGCKHIITGDCIDITGHARAVQVAGIFFLSLAASFSCLSYCELANPCRANRKKLLECCE